MLSGSAVVAKYRVESRRSMNTLTALTDCSTVSFVRSKAFFSSSDDSGVSRLMEINASSTPMHAIKEAVSCRLKLRPPGALRLTPPPPFFCAPERATARRSA